MTYTEVVEIVTHLQNNYSITFSTVDFPETCISSKGFNHYTYKIEGSSQPVDLTFQELLIVLKAYQKELIIYFSVSDILGRRIFYYTPDRAKCFEPLLEPEMRQELRPVHQV